MAIRKILRRLPGANILRELRERTYLLKAPTVTPNGFKFASLRKMTNGEFETDVVRFIKYLFSRGDYDRFIDIGAHHGYYTCLAASLGMPTISFEPNNINRKVLNRNLFLNGFKNSIIFPYALSEVDSLGNMWGFGTGFSIFNYWAGDVSNKFQSIEFRALDNLFIEISNSIIKIDTEGSELQVLRGATNSFVKCSNSVLIIEVSKVPYAREINKELPGPRETIEFLVELGFYPIELREGNLGLEVARRNLADLVQGLDSFESANLFFKKA